MKYLLFLFLVLFLGRIAQAETITVIERVTIQLEGDVTADVTLAITPYGAGAGRSWTATTDANGRAVLELELPTASYYEAVVALTGPASGLRSIVWNKGADEPIVLQVQNGKLVNPYDYHPSLDSENRPTIALTPTPTETAIATLSPTAAPTLTAEPTVTPNPIATQSKATVEPSATPTQAPSPSAEQSDGLSWMFGLVFALLCVVVYLVVTKRKQL